MTPLPLNDLDSADTEEQSFCLFSPPVLIESCQSERRRDISSSSGC